MRLSKTGLVALAIVGGVAGGRAVHAQTASQIAPSDLAPPVSRSGDRVALPDSKGPEAPRNADAIFLTLSDATVAGDGVPDAAAAELRAALVGRRISVADIYAAARALEQRLVRGGEPFARVVVPPQELVDGGRLTLRLVRGHIERVDTSALPPSVRHRIARVLAPLAGAQAPRLAEIERRLLLAGDTPGVTLRSTLTAGAAPGATALVIEADYRPVTVSVFADNRLGAALGGASFGVQASFNSVLGAGESVYLLASGLPSLGGDNGWFTGRPRNRALALGVAMPLGTDGLTATVEALESRTTPRRAPGAPGFASIFRRASLRLAYPLVRSRAQTISLRGAFDAQQERVGIVAPLAAPLSFDRLRVLRLGADARFAARQGGFARVAVTASFGIDGLGARSPSALLPLSRAGADAGFRKAAIEFDLAQPIARYLEAGVSGAAQTGFGKPLVNSEQFGIAHGEGISPAASGTLQGDSGYLLRAELRAPFSIALAPAAAVISPYGFAATGTLWLEQPTAVERRRTEARAYGVGVRFAVAGKDARPALRIGLEYGRARVDGRPDERRLTVNSILTF